MDDDYEVTKIRKEINNVFKVNAYVLKKDALDFCVDIMVHFDKTKRNRWMDKILGTLRKQSLESSVLTRDVFVEIISQISNAGQKDAESLFNVFDSFSLKQYVYNPEFNKLLPSEVKPKVAADAESAVTAFRNRFNLVLQRAKRCKQLQQIKFSTVEILLGSPRKIENAIVIGMLTQQKADCYHIEDLTGSLQIDFTDAEFRPGFFTEGGIYMFEGTYDANLLFVTVAAMAPIETAEDSRSYFGNENFFGGTDPIAFRCNKKLIAAEHREQDACIVVLSDIYLDQPNVMKAIFNLFTGFVDCPPVAFIMCGNFCSKSRQPDTMALLETGFRRLYNQLNLDKFRKAFKDTNFVFVPGPDDPALNMCIPRPHLPASLFKMIENIPNVSFSTNPVRIQYASKEIVVYREDIVEKICRHAINKVSKDDIPKNFTRTILSQAHLSPLPMHISPVLWDWDSILSLYPVPDLVITADKFMSFQQSMGGSLVANPGSFSRGSFGFHVYYPYHNKVEDSVVRDS